ncbi:hypothetical protein V8G54_032080 [Vigna mungo]|uniref:Uncharacterized protein n=1 Tax=Vigna mungo TaxID=3915 RepID=A0AAQ3MKX4_VIGMU
MKDMRAKLRDFSSALASSSFLILSISSFFQASSLLILSLSFFSMISTNCLCICSCFSITFVTKFFTKPSSFLTVFLLLFLGPFPSGLADELPSFSSSSSASKAELKQGRTNQKGSPNQS